jgi:hypothetical protein
MGLFIRQVEIERAVKDHVKEKDMIIESVIQAGFFWGEKSLITDEVKKQISIFLNHQLDKYKQIEINRRRRARK